MVSSKIEKLKKILICPSSFGEFDSSSIKLLEKNNFQITLNPFKRKIKNYELKELLKDNIIGTIAGLEEYDSEILCHSSLKIISRVGSGIDNIDLNYTNKKGIKVLNTPDGPTQSVAELTVCMMLTLLRNNFFNIESMKKNIWNRSIGNEMSDKNIVIIGYGRIGKKVAKILKSFCKNIFIVDPLMKSKTFKNITYEESLKIGEVFSLHTNSKNLFFTQNDLDKIKKENIYILNSSRGHNLDENAIIYGLNNKIINGVWLDVFKDEPYEKGLLFNDERILMTPHVSSYTIECRKNMEMQATLNLINFFNENRL